MREASILVVGHVFQEKEMPSSSSCIVGSNGSAGGGGAAMLDDNGLWILTSVYGDLRDVRGATFASPFFSPPVARLNQN